MCVVGKVCVCMCVFACMFGTLGSDQEKRGRVRNAELWRCRRDGGIAFSRGRGRRLFPSFLKHEKEKKIGPLPIA